LSHIHEEFILGDDFSAAGILEPRFFKNSGVFPAGAGIPGIPDIPGGMAMVKSSRAFLSK